MSSVSDKSDREKVRVPLLLASHIADMLDDLCAYYDTDRTNCLRRLIWEDHTKMIEKKAKETP